MTHIQIHKKYKIEADLDLTIPNINWHTGYSSCFDDYFIEEMINVYIGMYVFQIFPSPWLKTLWYW